MADVNHTIGFILEGPISHGNKFEKKRILLKPFEDYDVDVKVEACSLCGTDVHIASGEWKGQLFPLCLGHEAIGRVVRTGSKVTMLKIGQRVGIGAQCASCGVCSQCTAGNETYCSLGMVHTVGSKWPDTGIVSQGGFASHMRIHESWAFPIPDAIDSVSAASMMCGGITAYSPLVSYTDIKDKKVGILGLGGIGHFGVLWAKALGAEVWVISRGSSKEKDAFTLGADGYISTASDEDWTGPHRLSFDFILNTVNSSNGFQIAKYLSLLNVRGFFISIGLPLGGEFKLTAFDLLGNAVLLGASHIGSRKQVIDMLQLAVDKGVRPWVEAIPLDAKALQASQTKMKESKARFRITFTEYDSAFE